jgi:ArsR family transcriptional regulator, arsenate/arsenite/antimonite-responsive transcriptional repressor
MFAGTKDPPMTKSKSAFIPTVACCSAVTDTLPDSAALDLARRFAALADPVRLRLFNLVASSPSGEMCACDLAEPVAKSQPTVSHHMKLLYEAGLVRREKRGTWVWYSVDPEGVAALRSAVS